MRSSHISQEAFNVFLNSGCLDLLLGGGLANAAALEAAVVTWLGVLFVEVDRVIHQSLLGDILRLQSSMMCSNLV